MSQAVKKTKKTHSREEIFLELILNGIFLIKSYLPKSSLTVLIILLIDWQAGRQAGTHTG
jgi:hypothetical protein